MIRALVDGIEMDIDIPFIKEDFTLKVSFDELMEFISTQKEMSELEKTGFLVNKVGFPLSFVDESLSMMGDKV